MHSQSKILVAFALMALSAVVLVGAVGPVEASDEPKVEVDYVIGGTAYTESVGVVKTTDASGDIYHAVLSPVRDAFVPDGMSFYGWYAVDGASAVPAEDYELTVLDPTATPITFESAVFYAVFVPESVPDAFTVVYVVPGQSDVIATVPEGTPMPVQLIGSADFGAYGVSVPESKVFKGWYATAYPTEADSPVSEFGIDIIEVEVSPSSDGVSVDYFIDSKMVYAVLGDNTTYTVRFIVDGAETSATFWTGSPVVMPADPVKEGFIFKEWSVSEDGLTYTAVFEAVPAPEPEPEPAKDNSSMTALLCVIGVVFVCGAIVFVWTLKKDGKN